MASSTTSTRFRSANSAEMSSDLGQVDRLAALRHPGTEAGALCCHSQSFNSAPDWEFLKSQQSSTRLSTLPTSTPTQTRGPCCRLDEYTGTTRCQAGGFSRSLA